MPHVFITIDGYRLQRVGDGWTDGDMVFQSGPDGRPVSDSGEALEGDTEESVEQLRALVRAIMSKPVPDGAVLYFGEEENLRLETR